MGDSTHKTCGLAFAHRKRKNGLYWKFIAHLILYLTFFGPTSIHWPIAAFSNPFILISFQVFKTTNRSFHFTTLWGPLTPLTLNPDFTPGINVSFLKRQWPHTVPRAQDFFNGENIKSLEDFPLSQGEEIISWWVYFQIRQFLLSSGHAPDFWRSSRSFEILCVSSAPRRQLVSLLYGLLFEDLSAKADGASKAWEFELGIQLEEWKTVNSMVHSGSVSVSAQENGYKLRSRWYRMAVLLHKMYPSTSERC